MPRPRKATPSRKRMTFLPEDLAAEVEILLFSEIEGRVPHGAWSAYVEQLIRQDLAARKRERGQS